MKGMIFVGLRRNRDDIGTLRRPNWGAPVRVEASLNRLMRSILTLADHDAVVTGSALFTVVSAFVATRELMGVFDPGSFDARLVGVVRGQVEPLPPLDADVAKLTHENAARLFRHPLPPPSWMAAGA